MLQLFRTNSPLAAIIVAIYAILLNLHGFLLEQSWEPECVGLAGNWIYKIIPPNTIWDSVSCLIIIVVQALMVNALVNRYKIARNVTYFPAVFYVLSMSFLKDAVALTPLLMGMTFFIIALFQLFGIYKKRGATGVIFNVGFWLAVGSMFYLSLGVFLLLGIIGISMLINLRLRELVVLIIGFLTPYYLAATCFFWVDGLHEFWDIQVIRNTGFLDFKVENTWKIWPKLIFAGVVIIFSLVNIQGLLSKTKIQIQKYIWLLFWSLPIAALSVFVQAGIQTEHLIIICVPISVFLSLHFLGIKNKPISEFLHLFFLMLFFAFQYWETILG